MLTFIWDTEKGAVLVRFGVSFETTLSEEQRTALASFLTDASYDELTLNLETGDMHLKRNEVIPRGEEPTNAE